VAELGTLDGGVPVALLLIESAHQEVHLTMDLPIGMGLRGGTPGALALMDITQGHGLTLSEVSWKSMPCYQKAGS
jgi:hypothetical protein